MTFDDMLRIDLTVCRGLGKRPGEAIIAAASRALRGAPQASTRKAAAILVGGSNAPNPWERMRRAAELLVPEVGS